MENILDEFLQKFLEYLKKIRNNFESTLDTIIEGTLYEILERICQRNFTRDHQKLLKNEFSEDFFLAIPEEINLLEVFLKKNVAKTSPHTEYFTLILQKVLKSFQNYLDQPQDFFQRKVLMKSFKIIWRNPFRNLWRDFQEKKTLKMVYYLDECLITEF